MKMIELSCYDFDPEVCRIVCRDDAIDDAMCALLADVMRGLYRASDDRFNPDFLPVLKDLGEHLAAGYDRSAVFAWADRHRSWVQRLDVIDLGDCEVEPGGFEGLSDLFGSLAAEHPASLE